MTYFKIHIKAVGVLLLSGIFSILSVCFGIHWLFSFLFLPCGFIWMSFIYGTAKKILPDSKNYNDVARVFFLWFARPICAVSAIVFVIMAITSDR